MKNVENLKLKILITLVTCHLSLVTPVYAQAPDIGQARITPASPLYFLKAARETLEPKFARTVQTKRLLQLKLAGNRLREVNTLLSQNQDLIQPTLERYMFNLNSLPDELSGEDALGIKIKEALNIHLAALEQMYPLVSSPKAKMAIRSVMYRIIQRADVISTVKLPVCAIFVQEASSSAFSDTEKFVLANRAEKCLTGARPQDLVK